MSDLCVVGSFNMDLVVRAPRFPRPGESLVGSGFETHPGGKGANQALAAARLGARVAMVGCVGPDAFGAACRQPLVDAGVDLSGVVVRAGQQTGVGLITLDPEGENTIVVALGANLAFTPEDVDQARPLIRKASLLLLQLELPLDSVVAAARLAEDAGIPVMLNAAPACALPEELLRRVDVLIVNETEARVLAADDTDPLAGLAATGVRSVFMTLGAGGVRYRHAAATGTVPSFVVDSVDSVGAGDAFVGALAAAWAPASDDDAAVRGLLRRACAAGALATTVRGAMPSLPSADAVAGLLARG